MSISRTYISSSCRKTFIKRGLIIEPRKVPYFGVRSKPTKLLEVPQYPDLRSLEIMLQVAISLILRVKTHIRFLWLIRL